ncbi:MAG: hypothetical protein KF729_27380 [Sandaracinaceae bacterium]|nr:hypothetical protein [Sandaracinaceae bacterium]
MTRAPHARALVLAAALALGCAQRAPTPLVHLKASAVEAFARALEADADDATRLSRHFDWESMAERTAPPGLSPAERDGFLEGVRGSLGSDGSGLLPALAAGRFSFRGVVWRDGAPTARFRFLPPEGGFNFHDLVIARRADGPPRVVDLFVLTSSEYLTESMRRMSAFLLGRGSSLAARLLGGGGASAEEIEQVARFNALSNGDDPEAALAAHDALPPALRRQRAVRLLRVQVASRLEDTSRYLAILNETAVNMPNDPALSTMMLDAHFLAGDFAGCLRDLDAIRASYQDPYLDAFEGRIHVAAGEHARALEVAERVIAVEPGLIDGHDVALLAALGLGRAERARAALDVLERDHGVDPRVLATMAGYEAIGDLPAAAD